MALLSCQGLVLGYENKRIIDDVTFDVNSGDYLCVVGENGSGKSTLIKTLLRLIPAVEGQALYSDGLEPNEIGYLPQQTAVQRDFPASVREVVLSGCLSRCGLRPFYNNEEKQAARENMDKLGISDISKRCYRELSGGQQQRVLLARALCATKKLLLLDEPVSGLDPKATADMYALIEKLNKDEGITVIMISHDMASSIKYASHILHLGEKKPLFFGKKQDYIESGVADAFIREVAV